MLRSYVIAALRNLRRQRWYAVLNVSGLAVGVASSTLAFLYVYHEWSFDSFHDGADRIHLIRYDYKRAGSDSDPTVATPPVLAPTLNDELPGIGSTVRAYWGSMSDGIPVVPGDTEPLMARGAYVDPGFFDVFGFPVAGGDPARALADPRGVVLSRHMARRGFGDADPVGQGFDVIMEGERRRFEVRGVVDVPTNSSITFDFAISHDLRDLSRQTDGQGGWGMCHVLTFVKLTSGIDRELGEELLTRISEHLIPEKTHRGFGGDRGIHLRLLPLTEMHFTRGLRDIPHVLDPAYCWIVAGIALGVLAIACVNFVNLSLALMTRRTREVGIRKTAGASRQQLARQFLAEALLVALVSVGAGIALAEIALPSFGTVVDADIASSPGTMLAAAAVLIAAVALATGLYPSLLLSRLETVKILRGALRFGGTSLVTRTLVALQFACSVVFAVVALVMASQVDHLRQRGLGFDTEQVLIIDVNRGQPERSLQPYEALPALLREARDQGSDIVAVGGANNRFVTDQLEGTVIDVGGDEVRVRVYFIDGGFLATLGIDLVAGRPLDAERPADRTDVMLVNKAMAQLLGGDDVVGRMLTDPRSTQRQRRIVGIVDDFHGQALRSGVAPSLFMLPRHAAYLSHIYVRLAPGDVAASMAQVASVWSQVFPGRPLPYTFLDQDVANALRQDGRWIPVTRIAAGVGILIAGLGLLGLTALAVDRRTKEIGVRRAVGAPVVRIVALLSSEFTLLVLVANAVAWPLAALLCSRWLEGFADRIALDWAPFALAGATALSVAWVMMAGQALRAARGNPVDALRYE